jgi:hypothetical protein
MPERWACFHHFSVNAIQKIHLMQMSERLFFNLLPDKTDALKDECLVGAKEGNTELL